MVLRYNATSRRSETQVLSKEELHDAAASGKAVPGDGEGKVDVPFASCFLPSQSFKSFVVHVH